MGVACLGAASSAPAQGPPTYPDAVVLVSGYNSTTAFTSPDSRCKGREGPTWNIPTGPAAALRAARHDVFTAPVRPGSDPGLPPCTTSDAPVPPSSAYIDSYGDLDENGKALANFLAFLRDSYGVQRVQLVAHSNGGNWSRAAFTQHEAYRGLNVRSLTTLGTPHAGAFLADFAVQLNNGKCDFKDTTKQVVCQLLLGLIKAAFADSGPTTVRELTQSYMRTWNPDQRIGSCPVTTIAGTFLQLPGVPYPYYNPLDGLLGQASADAHDSLDFDGTPILAPNVPGLRSGGGFPVVHSPALSILSDDNLLNHQALSDRVVNVVGTTPAGGPLCTPDGDAFGDDKDGAVRLRAPLRVLRAPSRTGLLGDPGPEDVVFARAGTRIRCGLSRPPLIPLLDAPRLLFGLPAGCDRPLRVGADGAKRRGAGGRARPAALLMRSLPHQDVIVRARGDRVRIRVRGRGHDDFKVTAGTDGDREVLDLDRNGSAQLPKGEEHTLVSIRARGRSGPPVTATVVIER